MVTRNNVNNHRSFEDSYIWRVIAYVLVHTFYLRKFSVHGYELNTTQSL
jgi:hypothetical protein